MLGLTYASAQILDHEGTNLPNPETEAPPDIYWHVKAFRPEAKLLDVKAIDPNGKRHDVKAIQNSDDTSMLNIKALVHEKRLPIKVIVRSGSEQYYPVKAIDDKGSLIDIKAITEDGETLDVKGFSRSGNLMNLRAITKDSRYYNIISISPTGMVNAVKGIKMFDSEEEAIINGVSIFAHVKSLRQN
jgi:hypothetical protein